MIGEELTTVGYAPGRWTAVVTSDAVAVVDASVGARVVATLWDALGAGAGLHAVLDILTAGTGGTLADLPDFAIALRDGEATRIAVRGGLAVSTGTGVTSGAGVTTWTEQVVTGDVQVAEASAPSAPYELAVRDGIVRASALEIHWGGKTGAPARPVRMTGAEAPTAAAPAVADTPLVVETPLVDEVPIVAAPSAPAADPAPEASAPEASAPAEFVDPLLTPDPFAPSSASDALVDSVPILMPEPAIAIEADAVGDTRVVVPELPPQPEPDPSLPPIVQPGDHDGATISVAEARALRAQRGETVPPPLAPPRPPAPGRVRLSTGEVVALDRTVVVGRRPRSTRVTGTDLPRLVAVDSPQHDISRSHLELRVEGGAIVATDLQTTNGTMLHRAGAAPTRLHPGEPTVVVPDDLLDLGDGVTVTIEGIE